jgi:hypothetical protein
MRSKRSELARNSRADALRAAGHDGGFAFKEILLKRHGEYLCEEANR